VVLCCSYSGKETNKLVACTVVCAKNRRDKSKELGKPCIKYASIKNRPNESVKGKGKGKIHPIAGHEGPEGEQMYSSNLSSTSVLDGDGWSTPRPGRLTSGKDPVSIV